MKHLLVCERDPECPWTAIVDATYPVKGEADRERHHAAHDRKAAHHAVDVQRHAAAVERRELKDQRRAVRAQRRALEEGSVERTTVRAGIRTGIHQAGGPQVADGDSRKSPTSGRSDESAAARRGVSEPEKAGGSALPARTTPLNAMRTPAGASRPAGRGETNGRGEKVAHAAPRGTGMPRRGEDEGGRSKAIKESAAAAPTASSRPLAVATPCPMCALDIFPGHGHLRETDGGTVITRPSTIRWAA